MSTCAIESGAEIINQGGSLRCESLLPKNADGLPNGTFAQSCYGCTVKESHLECSHCLDAARKPHASSLELAGCASFGNQDGQLTCDKKLASEASTGRKLATEAPLPKNADGLPGGNFVQSCHGCKVTESHLVCSHCFDAARKPGASSLELVGCASFGNQDGQLTCDKYLATGESTHEKPAKVMEEIGDNGVDTDLSQISEKFAEHAPGIVGDSAAPASMHTEL